MMVSLSTDREIIYTYTDYTLLFTHRLIKTVLMLLFFPTPETLKPRQNGDKENTPYSTLFTSDKIYAFIFWELLFLCVIITH